MDRTTFDNDYLLIYNTMKKHCSEAGIALDSDMPKEKTMLPLTGGYTKARVYRILLGDGRTVIIRVSNSKSIKRELEVFKNYIYHTVITKSLPIILFPTKGNGKGDGIPDSHKIDSIFDEDAFIIYNDEVDANLANYVFTLYEALFKEDCGLELLEKVIQELYLVLGRLREKNKGLKKNLSLKSLLRFYNSKLPPALVIAPVSDSHNSQYEMRSASQLCKDYADRVTEENIQGLEIYFIKNLPPPEKWQRKLRIDVEDSWIEVENNNTMEETTKSLKFSAKIINTRRMILTEMLKKVLDEVCAVQKKIKDLRPTEPGEIFTQQIKLENDRHLDIYSPLDLLDMLKYSTDYSYYYWNESDSIYWPEAIYKNDPKFRNGFIHGDLHPGNILCLSKNQNDFLFSFIDFERASVNSPIADDFGRLEASLLIKELSRKFVEDEFDIEVLIKILIRHWANPITKQYLTEAELDDKYQFCSSILSAIRTYVTHHTDSIVEKTIALQEHLWCVFFNSLRYFTYKQLNALERLVAWLVATLTGTIAKNPWLLTGTVMPDKFDAILKALEYEGSQMALDLSCQLREDVLGECDFWVEPPLELMIEQYLPDYKKILDEKYADLVKHFVNMSALPGATDWTYEVPLTAKSLKKNENIKKDKDVDEIVRENSALVLLGPPGAGKSTVGAHLLKNAANSFQKLPILVNLPDVEKIEYEITGKLKEKIGEELKNESFRAILKRLKKEIGQVMEYFANKVQDDKLNEAEKELYKWTLDRIRSFGDLDESGLAWLLPVTAIGSIADNIKEIVNIFTRGKSFIPYFLELQLSKRFLETIAIGAIKSFKKVEADDKAENEENIRILRNCEESLIQYLWIFWRTGSLQLILDSLNEVRREKQEIILHSINLLVKRRWKNKIIVLSRLHNYSEGSLGIPEYSLVELNDDSFNRFVQKWFANKLQYTVNEAEQAREKLFETLLGNKASVNTRTFARTPLCLWMLLDVCYPVSDKEKVQEHQKIISNRSELFKMFVNDRINKIKIEFEKIHAIAINMLGNIAFDMVEYGLGTNITVERAKNSAGVGDQTFDVLIPELVKIGIIQTRDNDFRFTHQSIQEYFAARRLWSVSKRDLEVLREKVRYKTWEESFHLLILFNDIDAVEQRLNVFRIMRDERAYELIVDCLNRAEHVEWNFIAETIIYEIFNEKLPLPMRKETLLSLGRLSHSEIDKKEIVISITSILKNKTYKYFWVEALEVLQKIEDTPIILQWGMEKVLTSGKKIRTTMLKRAAEGSLSVKSIHLKLLDLLAKEKLKGEDVFFTLKAFNREELDYESIPDQECRHTLQKLLICDRKAVVEQALKWMKNCISICSETINKWLESGWLDLAMEYVEHCREIGHLIYRPELIKDFSYWINREENEEGMKELSNQLKYLELTEAGWSERLGQIIHLVMLNDFRYGQLTYEAIVRSNETPKRKDTILLEAIKNRANKKDFKDLLEQLLKESFDTQEPYDSIDNHFDYASEGQKLGENNGDILFPVNIADTTFSPEIKEALDELENFINSAIFESTKEKFEYIFVADDPASALENFRNFVNSEEVKAEGQKLERVFKSKQLKEAIEEYNAEQQKKKDELMESEDFKAMKLEFEKKMNQEKLRQEQLDATAFILGEMIEHLSSEERSFLVEELKIYGNKMSRCDSLLPVSWYRLLYLIRRGRFTELLPNVREWSQLYLGNFWGNILFYNLFVEICRAFILVHHAFHENGGEFCADYYRIMYNWIGKYGGGVHDYKFENCLDARLRLNRGNGQSALSILVESDDSNDKWVAYYVLQHTDNTTSLELLKELYQYLENEKTFNLPQASLVQIQNWFTFHFALLSQEEQCHEVDRLISQGNPDMINLFLNRFANESWTAPLSIPAKLANTLTKKSIKALCSVMNKLPEKSAIYGSIALENIAPNLKKIFVGCLSDDDTFKGKCFTAIADWASNNHDSSDFSTAFMELMRKNFEKRSRLENIWTTINIVKRIASKNPSACCTILKSVLVPNLRDVLAIKYNNKFDVRTELKEVLTELAKSDKDIVEVSKTADLIANALKQLLADESAAPVVLQERARILQLQCSAITHKYY